MATDSTHYERSGFRQWLDRRTGLDSLLHHALDEPIPGGAKIAYVFGSGLLFLFLSQVISGVFLAMYYVREEKKEQSGAKHVGDFFAAWKDRKSTRLNCSHGSTSYVFI